MKYKQTSSEIINDREVFERRIRDVAKSNEIEGVKRLIHSMMECVKPLDEKTAIREVWWIIDTKVTFTEEYHRHLLQVLLVKLFGSRKSLV